MPRQNLLLFRSKGKAEELDEPKVVRACLEGDRQAFEKIVERDLFMEIAVGAEVESVG